MMRLAVRISTIFVAALFSVSCVATSDIRTQMLRASQTDDPNFPDGRQRKLTQFAYIGNLAVNGSIVRVVAVRSVICGMLAPRGQAWLGFYDRSGRFIGEHAIDVRSPPLWCEGHYVYFSGLQSDGEKRGNALDLGAGFARREYVLMPVEGSWTPNIESVHKN